MYITSYEFIMTLVRHMICLLFVQIVKVKMVVIFFIVFRIC